MLGFEFGGLLALSVYASVWKQTCLSISNLSQSTMCVTFGVPLVPLKTDKILDECYTKMKENSHIFQLHGDFVSRLLQFDDITNEIQHHDKVSHFLLYSIFILTIIVIWKNWHCNCQSSA